MTAVTQDYLLYGFRRAKLFKLTAAVPITANANGAVDDGVYIQGGVDLNLPIPQPRQIVGFGNDGITQVGTLPSQERPLGTLKQEAFSDPLFALATGVKTISESEAKVTPVLTDTQGSEPLFMLIAWCMATGLTDGADVQRTVIVPACKFIPSDGFNMAGDKGFMTWNIMPRPVKKLPNGVALTRATHGCLSASWFIYTAENPMNVCLWMGDNTVTKFLFPVDWQAVSDAKSELYHYGATEPGTWALDGYTPTTKPAASYSLMSFYETPAIAA
jgi:hypothetical protein